MQTQAQPMGPPPRDHKRFTNIQQWLRSTGIEHQPGPALPRLIAVAVASVRNIVVPPTITGGYTLRVGNITSLITHLSQVCTTEARSFIIQEHSAPKSEWAQVMRTLNAQGRRAILGCLDPETAKPLAGVGVIYRAGERIIRVKPATTKFAAAVATGRLDHYAIDIGHPTALSCYNIYGWSGGPQNTRLARRTNGLFECAIDEIDAQPLGPACIVGDINGDPEHFKALQELLNHRGWTDLGAQAYRYGSEPNIATCRVRGSETRRDYIVCSPEAIDLVHEFKVVQSDDYPVHAHLQLTLKLPPADARRGDAPSSDALTPRPPNLWEEWV